MTHDRRVVHEGERAPRSGPQVGTAGLALTVLLLTLCPLAAPARATAQVVGPPITLDFQDLDLAYVLSALATAAGMNVIYNDLPQKPITIRTANPVPREEL